MHSPKKFLLIDDDEAYNFINRITLTETISECSVTEALSGLQALEYLSRQEDCPEVILLDINMPEMDGFEFLKEFDTRRKCIGHTRIFMLTSSVREADRATALSFPSVTGYFDKPLSVDKIADILKTL